MRMTQFFKPKAIIHSLLATALLTAGCYSANLFAQDEQHLSLYIPISSKNRGRLVRELNHAAHKYALGSINVIFSDHWHQYQQGLKIGRKGVFFAPPHFSAWAVNQHGFIPLVRLYEPLSYAIVTKKSEPQFFELNDLINNDICTHKPLHINYLLTNNVFKNHYAKINIQFVESVVAEMLNETTTCNAFTTSNHIIQRWIQQGNDEYIRLYQGRTYNNYGFVAHPSIGKATLNKLQEFLLLEETQKIFRPIYQLHANDLKVIKSVAEDYPVSYIDNLINHWQTTEQ